MPGEEKSKGDILQGTLDLIVLRVLGSMGPQHAYSIAARVQQISGGSVLLKQGTLYPALVRLEQQGWIAPEWGKTENNREAKFYKLTRAGTRALATESARWRRSAGLIERLLFEGE